MRLNCYCADEYKHNTVKEIRFVPSVYSNCDDMLRLASVIWTLFRFDWTFYILHCLRFPSFDKRAAWELFASRIIADENREGRQMARVG